ncbi:hypothetical protein [Nocardia sp. NPDC052566]|uniref:hypothetical protein n=1 Tax=Nocardia sp. NPDC052566 TaxID=3364330 RepID=UPI0037CAC97B
MKLLRDEPQWKFTGFPGFATSHLRVWRALNDVLAAIVTEELGTGTELVEGFELVLAELEAEYLGETIDFIHCVRHRINRYVPVRYWDEFYRVVLYPGGQTSIWLIGPHVVDHLDAHDTYFPDPPDGWVSPDGWANLTPCLTPGDERRMPGC